MPLSTHRSSTRSLPRVLLGRSGRISYQRLLAPTHICPIAHADGSYRVWRLCELFPCLACCFDNGVIMVEDAVGEPVGAHILPDVLHRVQLGRAPGQEDRLYVRGHFELAGRMPSRPVHEQHSHRSLGSCPLTWCSRTVASRPRSALPIAP